jgi:low affinity Fe/Cu permease
LGFRNLRLAVGRVLGLTGVCVFAFVWVSEGRILVSGGRWKLLIPILTSNA